RDGAYGQHGAAGAVQRARRRLLRRRGNSVMRYTRSGAGWQIRKRIRKETHARGFGRGRGAGGAARGLHVSGRPAPRAALVRGRRGRERAHWATQRWDAVDLPPDAEPRAGESDAHGGLRAAGALRLANGATLARDESGLGDALPAGGGESTRDAAAADD